jgi:catechol 2,3-dioxygenase-like lactoylglutathione lyase family enzyme
MAVSQVDSLNHVALSVRDLEASTDFYVRGLGLRRTLVKPVSPNAWRALRFASALSGRTAFVQAPGRRGQLELVQWDGPPEQAPPAGPRVGGQIGHVVLSFAVDDIHAVHHRLRSIGAECYSEPIDSVLENYGQISMFICEDPDGYQIEIVKLPSREEIQEFRRSASAASAGSAGSAAEAQGAGQ